MGIFTKKINSEEYEKLSKRLSEALSRIEVLEKQNEVIKTNANSLRGIVNRKLGGQLDDTETNKYKDFLPL